jgi:hypothetical protein
MSPDTFLACFWHPSLLRRRHARSAEGMGVKCIGLFAYCLVIYCTVETAHMVSQRIVYRRLLASLLPKCRENKSGDTLCEDPKEYTKKNR